MVDRVQFEETPIPATPIQAIPSSRMTAFLIQKGIVQSEAQATVLLVGTIILCVLGAVFFFVSATTEEEVYEVEAPLEEQRNNPQ